MPENGWYEHTFAPRRFGDGNVAAKSNGEPGEFGPCWIQKPTDVGQKTRVANQGASQLQIMPNSCQLESKSLTESAESWKPGCLKELCLRLERLLPSSPRA